MTTSAEYRSFAGNSDAFKWVKISLVGRKPLQNEIFYQQTFHLVASSHIKHNLKLGVQVIMSDIGVASLR